MAKQGHLCRIGGIRELKPARGVHLSYGLARASDSPHIPSYTGYIGLDYFGPWSGSETASTPCATGRATRPASPDRTEGGAAGQH